MSQICDGCNGTLGLGAVYVTDEQNREWTYCCRECADAGPMPGHERLRKPMTIVQMLRACGDGISNEAADRIEMLEGQRERMIIFVKALCDSIKEANKCVPASEDAVLDCEANP